MAHAPVDMLRERGLQVTAQRVAVLRAVSAMPHATADELARHVRLSLGAVSRQAVYDVLAVLVESRIVRRIEPAGSPARYEDRVGDNHHHAICRTCGRTRDVDCSMGKAPCLSPAARLKGFTIEEAEVIYWGTCASCRKATRAARPSKRRDAKR